MIGPGRILAGIRRRIGRHYHALRDFARFARGATPLLRLLRDAIPANGGTVLIVAGNGMNVVWAQLWTVLVIPLRLRGYRGVVLTSRGHPLLNRYFKLVGLDLAYLEDIAVEIESSGPLAAAVSSAKTFEEIRDLQFDGAPVGQIALSTYSRNFGTGVIRLEDPEVARYVRDWVLRVCAWMRAAHLLFERESVRIVFLTEVFMEEYGALYYAALNERLNVVRFAGTVRDDAIIVQHLSHDNDRIHHSSLDRTTFEQLLRRDDDDQMAAELQENFHVRYSDRWHRSRRNHPNTRIMDPADARRVLGITPERRVAVIYSHILYDTLFFFGTDLFADYATWLVETTRAAIGNPHLDWLVKVHPSNRWRGELDTLLKGQYEEERLLGDTFGALPPHVRIVTADTPINPLTWFELADYGITVRGTSGLEMAALGKTVVTAGTGRYEGNGFTLDPATAEDYLSILGSLHEVLPPDAETVRRAKRYAHGIFVSKPFTINSVRPCIRSGRDEVRASDDLVYVPVIENGRLPPDLDRFGQWVLRTDDRDLLS